MKVKLTNAKVDRLVQAVKGMDKPSTATGKPFAFKEAQGQVLYNLAYTLRKAEDAWQDVFEARNKLLKSLLPPGENELKGDLVNQFTLGYQGILDTQIDLEVRRIKTSALRLEENFIPADVLAGLGPILIDDANFPDE